MATSTTTRFSALEKHFDPRDATDEKISVLVEKVEKADAVMVGIASGMSSAGGSNPYQGGNDPLFDEYLGAFREKLGITSWFNGFYHPFRSQTERMAYIAAMAEMLYHTPVMQQYWDLKELLHDKDYFVLTTNQDQIARKTFGDENTAWIQGDWGWMQCIARCSDEVYPAHEFYRGIMEQTVDCDIDESLMPRCSHCGAPLEPWVRGYDFLEGTMYREQYTRYKEYLSQHMSKKVLFLELGVGAMTPMFIKEPFWNYTYGWPSEAFYIPITIDHAVAPREIAEQSLCFDADIKEVLHRAVELKRGEPFDTQDDSSKVEHRIAFPGGRGLLFKAAAHA